MSPLTGMINAIHHGRLSPPQRRALIALLLNLASCSEGMAYCPEMTPVKTAYHTLLTTADQHPDGADDPAAAPARTPLTLDQLIALLIQLRALYPAQGPRFVHLLNMDHHGDGLVTDVDVDCFEPENKPVTSLLSSP